MVSLRRRGRLSGMLGVLVACGAPDPGAPPVTDTVAESPLAAAIQLGATPIAIDEAGVPRLLRATATPLVTARTAADTARLHVERLAPAWGVRAMALPVLEPRGSVAVLGGTITRLAQIVDGLPVDGGELRVMTGPRGELLVASGILFGHETPRTATRYADDDTGAIARAMHHAYGRTFDAAALATTRIAKTGERILAGASGGVVVELARARQGWHVAGSSLVAAWIVEAYASLGPTTSSDAFRSVLAASDGRVLEHRSLVADAAFHYRVFADPSDLRPKDGPTEDFTPHPTGAPDRSYPGYAAPALVTVEALNQTRDPWLPANATETVGNNVDAYADVHAPNGLTFGDFRATTTGANSFDRVYDTAAGPLASDAQQMAAVTSLFYNINWLHDFWYDAGFTEATGNAQDSNYGRGGEDRDAMLAEAQDNALAGSRNNANMSTPSDGLPPRMQIYLWSGKIDKALTLMPSGRTPPIGHANFGPTSFDVTAPLALANDGAGANPTDGCEPFALPGQIALVDRGNCNFTVKVGHAQAGGALGVIVANNVAGQSPQSPLGGTDPALTIPLVSVTMEEGIAIKANLQDGAVSARLERTTGVELDGSLDSTLIAHEFGHYLHHRLSQCGTRWCGAISEGWGDFLALMMTARAGDDLMGAYPFSVYTTQSFSDDAGYFGIRRVPYSADLAKNALSFRHMADDEPLPTTHPMLPSANNAEVHNAGEVWTAALWDGYVALQQAGSSFDEVHRKMARYVVAGLLLSPPDVTPTEARDAILAAVLPASKADHDVLADAFARRGLGSCAESPSRTSTDFKGIVESSLVKGRALPSAVTVDDSANCDDDGVLDNNETARVSFAFTNPGAGDLANVTIAVTSATPGLEIVTPPITIASLPAYSATTIGVDIALDGRATGALEGALEIAITAPGACTERQTIPLSLRLNVDDVPTRSTTEHFDAASIWTVEGSSWRQLRETALDGYMHGPVPSAITDAALESPALQVGPEPFRITFQHRFDFEFSEGTYWDGGVIEFSRDGGITWADMATLPGVAPGYTGVLSNASSNPLADRMAYGGTNPAHPSFDTVTLDLGTQLANQTIHVRYRIGADRAVGSVGWELDDIVFEGLATPPFPAQEPDDGACGTMGGDGGNEPLDDGGCCGAAPVPDAAPLVTLGVLAIVLRRRRQK